MIRNCRIGNAVVRRDVDGHTAAGYDSLIANGGQDILATGNTCAGGTGTGIAAQSSKDDASLFRNIRIDGNRVSDQGAYGIIVYRSVRAIFQTLNIVGNIVASISGAIRQENHGRIFGCGIYIQGVEGVMIAGNTVRNANSRTEVETLAPAGIAVANARAVEILNNTVEDSLVRCLCL